MESINYRNQHAPSKENQIFLGVTFGMRTEDVSACLMSYGAKLMNADQYLMNSEIKLLEGETSFVPIHSFGERWETYYMPSIFIFDSFVEASFDFMNDRLERINIEFSPLAKREAQQLVDNLEKNFRSKYEFIRIEESNENPGAYKLIFHKNAVNLNLWVNLTEAKNPIVCVYIWDEQAKNSRKERREMIESNVF